MKCATTECKNEVNTPYKYCKECYTKWTQSKSAGEPAPPDRKKDPNKWDDDPVIDILLKINHNIGRIAQSVERQERAKE